MCLEFNVTVRLIYEVKDKFTYFEINIISVFNTIIFITYLAISKKLCLSLCTLLVDTEMRL